MFTQLTKKDWYWVKWIAVVIGLLLLISSLTALPVKAQECNRTTTVAEVVERGISAGQTVVYSGQEVRNFLRWYDAHPATKQKLSEKFFLEEAIHFVVTELGEPTRIGPWLFNPGVRISILIYNNGCSGFLPIAPPVWKAWTLHKQKENI